MTIRPAAKQPLNKPAHDVITLLNRKLQDVQDYERFLQDVRDDNRLTQLLIQLRHDDERNIELLKSHLGRLLMET